MLYVIAAIGCSAQSVNGHSYVDLGLSVNWATMNVGASTPTSPSRQYIYKEVPSWGNQWRLPTKEELEELKTRCKWSYSETTHCVKAIGPNGASIVFPLTEGGDVFSIMCADYWASTPVTRNSAEGHYYMYLTSAIQCIDSKIDDFVSQSSFARYVTNKNGSQSSSQSDMSDDEVEQALKQIWENRRRDAERNR